jgi:alpha-L-rhamnosidase
MCISLKKLSIVLIGLFSGLYAATAQIQVSGLKVESIFNPVGIDGLNPCFSWQWQSDRRGSLQTAYEILVASSKEKLQQGTGDLWSSGNVQSDQQSYVRYKGKPLESGKTYFWKVKILDNKQQTSPWSESGSFTEGILNPSEWKAKWITYDTTSASAQPIFRKPFTISKKIKRAIVFVSGLGYYELYLNGMKVGDHLLDPGQTNYEDYALYATYDLTNNLKQGENVAGIMLGGGWYNQNKVWGKNGLPYGNPLLICQMEIEYSDGTKQQITSDGSWQWTNGPVIQSNVYAGEVYNAQKEIANWSSDPKAKADWMSALLAKVHPPKLVAQSLPPIKKMKEIPVQKVSIASEGTYIFDFGQNFAGWTRLKVNAPAGTVITIRTAEEVDSEGKLNPWSTGVTATKVEQTEVYTCKGTGTEIWEPRFTYHGFRFAEVTGLPTKPNTGLLTGIVVYSSVGDVGNFSCSDDQLNRLHKLALWTFTSNIHSIPTDCPAREKCGWLGDAHAMVQMGIYNFGMENFWIKYLYDIRSTSKNEAKTSVYKTWNNQEQRVKPAGIPYMIAPGKRLGGAASPDWGTALVQIPWYIYLYYGNSNALREFYPDMKRWTDYIEGFAVDHIVDYGLGDWCPPGMIVPTDTPVKISSSAYHYLDLKIMEKAALLLGYKEDANRYGKTREAAKEAFIGAFYDREMKSFGSQTSNSMALDFGLAPTGEEKDVSDAIVRTSKEKLDGFMNTGIFGIARIFKALSRYGNEKAAIGILDKKGYNSFEYMWSKYHATTLWEILPVDSFYLKMKSPRSDRSHSHPMQGGYDKWYYECVAGISPDAETPGFKKIILNPGMFNEIKWEKCSYNSPYGTIKSDWQSERGLFKWHVTVPANTNAILYIPAGSEMQVKEGGKTASKVPGIRFLGNEDGRSLFEIGSGDYNFSVGQGNTSDK